MKISVTLFMLAVACSGCAPLPTQTATPINLNYDGLEQIDAQRFDVALVRPGIDFGAYDGLLIDTPALAFRTPDRSRQQFPLSRDQKVRFRDMLDENFRAELKTGSRLQLVDQAGPNVLKLKIRVQDILATVPPRAAAGVGTTGFALDAVGEATLVLELRDSESDEILARAADARAVEGFAMLQKSGPLTKWAEIEAVCERWAANARKGLDSLVGER